MGRFCQIRNCFCTPGSGEDDDDIAFVQRRRYCLPDNVRMETQVHESHGKGLCNKAGPAGADDVDPFCDQQFMNELLSILIRNAVGDTPDLGCHQPHHFLNRAATHVSRTKDAFTN
mgnify:CR=1 FL=1